MLGALRNNVSTLSSRFSSVCLSRHFATGNGDVVLGKPTKMTSSEAFVETLVANDVKDVFGIVGSAFMDPLDMFPEAGIRFVSVQHEQNAGHMADGYSRVTGKHGVCIAQNGPGNDPLCFKVLTASHIFFRFQASLNFSNEVPSAIHCQYQSVSMLILELL